MAEKNIENVRNTLLPQVDVFEDEKGITLFVDLPGVPKEQLHLKVEADRLLIEADIRLNAPEKMDIIYAEVLLARYRRVFSLSRELDSSKIDAHFEQGVLKLYIPKQTQAQPRKIEIKVAR